MPPDWFEGPSWEWNWIMQMVDDGILAPEGIEAGVYFFYGNEENSPYADATNVIEIDGTPYILTSDGRIFDAETGYEACVDSFVGQNIAEQMAAGALAGAIAGPWGALAGAGIGGWFGIVFGALEGQAECSPNASDVFE